MKWLLPCSLSLLLLGACGSARKTQRLHVTADTVKISATHNPMTVFRTSATRAWQLDYTRAALSFDYSAKTASGEAWLSLHPYAYTTDSIWLDAKQMQIHAVTLTGTEQALPFRYENGQLKIRLGKPYTAADKLELHIRYTAMPYAAAAGGSAAISDDRGLYFINTDKKIPGKPAQIWTQGETEANSHWLPTIDKPNSRTRIQLELTVPKEYTTLSNGALIASTPSGNMRKDVWRMDQPIQVYAIMFAIGEFTIVEDTRWRDRAVSYYVEPEYAPYARNIFKHTPEMMAFFSGITGVPFPWNKYSQIVVRDYVSGAMENTSASLFGEFVNQNNRELADKDYEDVVSHELFHQWFGDYVTAESWSQLTVNESFANYGEYLWRKYKYGQINADELAFDDLQKYLKSTAYSDPVLVRHYYMDHEDMFDRVSYQKGGAILHYLHDLAGDSAFYKAMNLYLTHNALQAAEATHWRLAVEAATGKDWNWFFKEWYERAGHPVLELRYENDDVQQLTRVTVSQVQPAETGLYQLPLKALIIHGTHKDTVDWQLRMAQHQFSYPYRDGRPAVVVPDIHHVLPGTIKEQKPLSQWLVQLTQTEDYISKQRAVAALAAADLPSSEGQQLLRRAVDDPIAAIRRQAIYALSELGNEQLRSDWTASLAALAGHDGNNSVRAAALYVLGRWKVKGRESLLLAAVTDSSYLVAGNALAAINRVAPDTAYRLARRNLDDKPGTHLDNQAWSIISEKGRPEDTVLFNRYADHNPGGKRDYLIRYVASYTMATSDAASANAALRLMGRMISRVEHKNQRAAYADLFRTLDDALAKKKEKQPAADTRNLLRIIVRELKANEKEEDILKIYDQLLSTR